MLFEVFRQELASVPDGHQIRPCEQAYWTSVARKDKKDIKDPAEMFDSGDTSWWYDYGTNHRTHKRDGYIVRNIQVRGWFVSFINVNELASFIQANGPIKIERDLFHAEYTLTILDTYKNPPMEMGQLEMVE